MLLSSPAIVGTVQGADWTRKRMPLLLLFYIIYIYYILPLQKGNILSFFSILSILCAPLYLPSISDARHAEPTVRILSTRTNTHTIEPLIMNKPAP